MAKRFKFRVRNYRRLKGYCHENYSNGLVEVTSGVNQLKEELLPGVLSCWVLVPKKFIRKKKA
jgi:hypothetical protein